VLATKQGLADVGCTAHIVEKVKEYQDGRMDILSEGRSVFRLVELLNEKEYHKGIVEYLGDEVSDLDLEKERQLIGLFDRCHLLLFGQNWAEAAGGEAGQLAYRMASRLPIDLPDRQTLLEMRSEKDRREFLQGWIARFLPEFTHRQRAHQRAGGNGHALN
jgi:Lon protease-like protein